ncbi:HSP20-like chaperone [Tilletiopsis washingtonensis]|uniref:HSP20-like chaperone n=1 Tax=Tilletiopsis washingtonensis TaxID=58919 RepID=A0A316YZA4_9BASI|nr:HSP20-like chaperone [Tilletiopsis washingtonensis]PWN94780.1 HSP20-like chaperone [Tilletiopsis washingtonensis]
MSLAHHLFTLSPFEWHADDSPAAAPAHSKAGEHGLQRAGSFFHPTHVRGPAMDVHELKDQYVVELELPGVRKEDVKLEVDEKHRRVSIAGTLKAEHHVEEPAAAADKTAAPKDNGAKGNGNEKKDGKHVAKQAAEPRPRVLISERAFGSFQRSFTLPQAADLSDIHAAFADGVLRINVRKTVPKDESTVRSIAIEDARL